MRIGILGSGLMGGKHGTIFARSGHNVVFSYSHSKQKLKQLARQAGNNARSGARREAAQAADLLASQPTRFGYADYCRLVTAARTRIGGMR